MLAKLNFALLLLVNARKKHMGVFFISTLLVFIVTSVLFISSSIQKDIGTTLEGEADITIQRLKAGERVDIPSSWIDELLEIQGIATLQGRVYGRHFYEPKERYFFIVGVDLYDKQVVKKLQKLIDSLDISTFLAKKNMIIGSGVKQFFDEYHFFNSYTFRPPDRSKEKVYIYDVLPKESDIVSSDMILMDINEARKILGMKKDSFSDIILNVKNSSEKEKVYEKLILSHFDTRIISKEDIQKHYKNIFNYKGGLFLSLYLVVMMSFLLLLYQRYTMVSRDDTQEIAILRSLGWRIDEVIWLKLGENSIIAIFAYLLGVIFAYIYVFFLDAPLLQNIFLGSDNLPMQMHFYPEFMLSDLVLLFTFFVLPFLLAIIIPLWRLSIEDIGERLR